MDLSGLTMTCICFSFSPGHNFSGGRLCPRGGSVPGRCVDHKLDFKKVFSLLDSFSGRSGKTPRKFE